MDCPHHDTGDDESDDDRERIDRREFVKAALAIGGTGALASLADRVGLTPTFAGGAGGASNPPPGDEGGENGRSPITAAVRHNRQHAWDAFERRTASGNTAPPSDSLLLLLDYDHDGPPAPAHRRQVEGALRGIERRFPWGPEGALFTMAYSGAYFERFEADPPPGAAPAPPAAVARLSEAVTGEAVEAETADAVLVLASANAANLLAVEAALWGEEVTVGDATVSFEATFEGVFARPVSFPQRRVGFAGKTLDRERYGRLFGVDVPETAPLSMGFVAGFDASVPEEDAVTLTRGQRFPGPGIDSDDVPTDRPYVDADAVGARDPGVFAQGTLKHLSLLELDLESWYDRDGDERRHRMYSPYHTAAETGPTGRRLTDPDDDDAEEDPGAEAAVVDDDVPDPPARPDDGPGYADHAPETATDGTALTGGEPRVGHSQKTARARYDLDGDGGLEQPVLRRDWDAIGPVGPGGDPRPAYHFNVPVRFEESIFSLLEATYNVEFTSLDGRIDHDAPAASPAGSGGIAPFVRARRRGNFLVPPVTVRALPPARAGRLAIEATRHGDVVRVRTGQGSRLDRASVRFGRPRLVNRARGARPMGTGADDDGHGPGSRGTSGRTGPDTDRTFVFPAEDADLADAEESTTVRLFGLDRETRAPWVGETELVP
jgi:hypothetical protein